MGFAILSKGFMSIVVWKDHLQVPRLYEIAMGQFTQLDAETDGSGCIWEDAIAAHETRAWANYLDSPRENADKRKYLTDFLESGPLEFRKD
jgi:hypothetical protein